MLRRCRETTESKLLSAAANTNSLRKQIWVRSCICTITLLMGKTMKIDNKRTSNNSLGLRTPQPSPLKNTCSVLEWRRGERSLKGRRKSILNISFQSNVNNLCCLCFLLLLFIYLLLSFQQPARFSKASRTGKPYQTSELGFKRLSLHFYLYIYSSLHLSCCYLAQQTHEALMRSKPDMYCWPRGYLNKVLNIVRDRIIH